MVGSSKNLTDEVAILAANALVTSRLDYCNSLFRSCPVSTCANYIVFKTQVLGLSQTVTNTHGHHLVSRLHWLPVEFRCIFKTVTLVYKFLHNGHPSYFGPLLSTRCGRYSTRYNHTDKRFLEVPQFCPSVHKSKNHFGHSFSFDVPWSGIICLMRSVPPQLSLFQEKVKIVSLQKCIPNLAYTLSGVSVVLDLATTMDR